MNVGEDRHHVGEIYGGVLAVGFVKLRGMDLALRERKKDKKL